MRLLKLVPENTNIDFVAKRKLAFILTILILLVGLSAIIFKGLNMGIDFKGGILMDASYRPAGQSTSINVAELRSRLDALELGEVSIQSFGAADTVLIRVQRQDGGDEVNARAVEKIKSTLGEGWIYNRSESVGPTVGNELMKMGILANLLAMLGIGIYVAFRFEWQFGVAALVATFHDVFVSLGMIAFVGLEFNLTSVAALLLLAGYSVNDTVIVFDRIRENLRRYKTMSMGEIINLSTNTTLSRTIMTSLTVMLAILPMLFWGGETLRPFSAIIAWGVFIGTFSSIYVAGALLIYLPPLRMGRGDNAAAVTTTAKA